MKYRFILLLAMFCLLTNVLGQNGFPYSNPLRTVNGMTILGGGSNGLPSFDSDGMTLTTTTKGLFSGAYITDLDFTTRKGFIVEFEYTMDGSNEASAADGFSVILFDSSVANKHLGIKGGGLGYAQNRLNKNAADERGFSGAYLGIGFDQWGNFRRQITYSPDNWLAGVPSANSTQRSQITIRGPQNGDEYTGYPVLRNVVTTATDQTKNGYEILSDGTYGQIGVSNFTPFRVRSSLGMPSPAAVAETNSAYRRVRIGMYPFGENTFYLNVSVYVGGADGITIAEVFKDIPMSTASTIKYYDIEYYPNTALIENSVSLAPPNVLKLAFAGSTGDGVQRQMIRNLSVSLPFAALATNDVITGVCNTEGSISEFNVLDNDLGYANLYYSPGMDLLTAGSKDNLDKSSFRFKVFNTTTGLYDPAPNTYQYTSASGTYTYDPSTGNIRFLPKAGLTSAVTEEIYYDIRNKSTSGTINLGSEEYRSNTAIVNVSISNENCSKLITKYFKING